jgi:hypothetical protein
VIDSISTSIWDNKILWDLHDIFEPMLIEGVV